MLSMLTLPFTLLWLAGSRPGLFLDKEMYTFDEVWWLVTPLAVVSIIAVFRVAFGHRDLLAPVVAGIWVLIGLGYSIGLGQFGLLFLTGVVLFLISSGTLADRNADSRT